MLPGTKRGQYGSTVPVGDAVADPDGEFCSWMVWILKRLSNNSNSVNRIVDLEVTQLSTVWHERGKFYKVW